MIVLIAIAVDVLSNLRAKQHFHLALLYVTMHRKSEENLRNTIENIFESPPSAACCTRQSYLEGSFNKKQFFESFFTFKEKKPAILLSLLMPIQNTFQLSLNSKQKLRNEFSLSSKFLFHFVQNCVHSITYDDHGNHGNQRLPERVTISFRSKKP